MGRNNKIIVGVVIIGLLLIGGWMLFRTPVFPASPHLTPSKQEYETHPQLIVKGKIFQLEIADTPAKQELGLSYRPSLPDDHAMIFVFPKAGAWPFWMKDMNFLIDMIWLDPTFKVVFSKKEALPDSYPTLYSSPTPALYVLETNAGFMDEFKIATGTKLVVTGI